MTDWNQLPENVGAPDFNNLLAVLRRAVPARPTLFEFFLNDRLHHRLAPLSKAESGSIYARHIQVLRAYQRAGYDFANVLVPGFEFPSERISGTRTISINQGGMIHDRASFDTYPWPDPAAADYAVHDVGG